MALLPLKVGWFKEGLRRGIDGEGELRHRGGISSC
jgi:hypothetical protein